MSLRKWQMLTRKEDRECGPRGRTAAQARRCYAHVRSPWDRPVVRRSSRSAIAEVRFRGLVGKFRDRANRCHVEVDTARLRPGRSRCRRAGAHPQARAGETCRSSSSRPTTRTDMRSCVTGTAARNCFMCRVERSWWRRISAAGWYRAGHAIWLRPVRPRGRDVRCVRMQSVYVAPSARPSTPPSSASRA